MSVSIAHRPTSVTPNRVLTSEWLKFWSLRANSYALLTAVTAMPLVSWLLSSLVNSTGGSTTDSHASFDPIGLSLSGATIAQLLVVVVGSVFAATEFRTGLITATFIAVPTRSLVVIAKCLLYAGVVTAVMTPAAVLSVLVGHVALGEHTDVTFGAACQAAVGVGVYLGGIGAISVATGFLTRSAAPSIGVLFTVLLLVPALAGLLPEHAQGFVNYLPGSAGPAMWEVSGVPGQLSPLGGFWLLTGYVVGAGVVAALVTHSRDI